MKAFGSCVSFTMRVLSPRIEPPERRDEGSTARTASTLAPPRQPGAEGFDERRFTNTRRAR